MMLKERIINYKHSLPHMRSKEKKVIKIGLIGFGNIGQKRLQALKKIKSVPYKIIYILDKKIKNEKDVYFKSINSVKLKKVDLLIVCLPTNQVIKTLKNINWNFKYLLLEKPGFNNLNVFKQFIKKANQKKIYIRIGYNLRFDEGIIKARNFLSDGKIGKLYSIKINYSNGTAKSNTNKIGSLFDIGSHSVNLIQWLLNSPDIGRKFKFIQKNEFMGKRKDDNGYIIARFKKIIIFLHFGFCSWKNTFELELIGSKGFVKVLSLPKWKDGQKVMYGKRVFPSGKPIIRNWTFKEENSFKNELLNILNNVNKNSPFNKKLNFNELDTTQELNLIK